MKCPACRELDNRVIDSRLGKDGEVIRRRRECERCGRRFTTYERVEEFLPALVKKDGRREAFDRLKVLGGLKKLQHHTRANHLVGFVDHPVDLDQPEEAPAIAGVA